MQCIFPSSFAAAPCQYACSEEELRILRGEIDQGEAAPGRNGRADSSSSSSSRSSESGDGMAHSDVRRGSSWRGNGAAGLRPSSLQAASVPAHTQNQVPRARWGAADCSQKPVHHMPGVFYRHLDLEPLLYPNA